MVAGRTLKMSQRNANANSCGAYTSTAVSSPVQLQYDDQRVLAREEDVHVTDNAVVRDEQQTEPQERRVLQQDVQGDAPHVNGAATRTAGRCSPVSATNAHSV